jgi:acyl dehydratase
MSSETRHEETRHEETPHAEARHRVVGGPWFEDFSPGDVFADAPGLTLTPGHAAVHQAVAGDRLSLSLDAALAEEVTGRAELLAHPSLVCDVAIGQSTFASHRVRANLFYRGLVLARPVFLGETLRTRTEVVALKQNRRREGAPATGLVVLRMRTTTSDGDVVLDFWRCPMIPLRDASTDTGHADDLGGIPQQLDPAVVRAAVPRWRMAPLREATRAPYAADLQPGDELAVEGGDVVSAAPELARLTLNLAMAHTDPATTADGRALVYGGHTISVAAAHATRALPALATIVAWEGCDHTGPVYEGDVLRSRFVVQGVEPLEDGALVALRAVVDAVRGPDYGAVEQVLDWRFLALIA